MERRIFTRRNAEPMIGPPHHIESVPNAIPYAIHGARPIPYAQWSHLESVQEVLKRCRKHQITLSPENFVFSKPAVKFVV
eukprot:TCALIF_08503-PA protein Name:"Protein of unknown function" AED:0.44 eAED:0.51 QI:0/0/0/1/0/0/3/0/79